MSIVFLSNWTKFYFFAIPKLPSFSTGIATDVCSFLSTFSSRVFHEYMTHFNNLHHGAFNCHNLPTKSFLNIILLNTSAMEFRPGPKLLFHTRPERTSDTHSDFRCSLWKGSFLLFIVFTYCQTLSCDTFERSRSTERHCPSSVIVQFFLLCSDLCKPSTRDPWRYFISLWVHFTVL